jgi:cyclopropane-fatty-acyl-phospholipid synthase
MGGLGLYLAEMTGANVTGVTLSTEQLQMSNASVNERNLTRSAKFLLQDCRDIPGPFDRIVSVGMFEYVGVDSMKPISGDAPIFSPTTAS